jgi:N-acetylmuramoyl-L-alanine amidase
MLVKRIAIEVGHGPTKGGTIQPGARGPEGMTEYALNHFTAFILSRALHMQGGPLSPIRFDTTIIDDPLPLPDLARRAFGHDAFISLHHNASAAHAAQGTEVLVRDMAHIMSVDLATDIEQRVAGALGIPGRGVKARPDLAVLASAPTNMPACLVESFFIDAVNSKQDAFRYAETAAYAIAIACQQYFVREAQDEFH